MKQGVDVIWEDLKKGANVIMGEKKEEAENKKKIFEAE